MISKFHWLNFLLSIISLVFAFIILIIPITKTYNAQVIFLQSLYSNLDKSWLFLRSLVFFLFSIAGISVVARNAQILKIKRLLRYFIVFCVLGLPIGLVIFYGYSCCDSPVVFFMGFPFSWLRGITPAQHYLPLPAYHYLIVNLSQIDWGVEVISLIADIFFWYNISLLVFISKQKSWLGLHKRRSPQST